MNEQAGWPSLPGDTWRDTQATLHMWTQIVGKLCLALTPLTNHFWNITFHVTSRGLVTPLLVYRDRTLNLTFDFLVHQLVIQTSDRSTASIPLKPRTVAEFHRLIMEAL